MWKGKRTRNMLKISKKNNKIEGITLLNLRLIK